ncbi:PAS domain-containing hybrid sensor histidine kinase/response regulator [Litorilituus lipolyticus]|uniref:histidine kinase n=1 Tax=Litorilituus lipolyticus TaxID=2491017 RepID=A0A502KTZ1_9GAMM|nr:PAS-domain containing protein [Litorilituus lipolyticus]TPH14594.1 response regulator [Litorilituus lipolyticus]
MLAWLSLDTWLISVVSLAYLLLLFSVAYWGQKHSQSRWLNRPWVYGLSIGVSCSSWAFYGTVGQAAATGAWLAPIYIGTILAFVIAWPMLLRILRITKQLNLTSIADFIACRYDRSPYVAACVTLVALLGTIPYIALQLRAISKSFDLLTGSYQSGISTTFVVTFVLIVFSILFGARQVAVNKQNKGLVLAIAFSSIIKLFALTAIGIFATFYLYDGLHDLLNHGANIARNSQPEPVNNQTYFAIAQAILGIVTVFILPQQFHMLMIENHNETELKTARWLYPLYLILINLFVLPIALAGQVLFPGGSVDADTFVLTIPLFYQQAWLAGLAYIGGLAAATSMIIVATIVLSTMVATEVVNPVLLKYNQVISRINTPVPSLLLNIRRISIALLLLFALAFERIIDQQSHLAAIGLLSFVLLAQLFPLLVGALYWRKATKKAALWGLIVGSAFWFYTLLVPALWPNAEWLTYGPFNHSWLKPTALFGINIFGELSHGLFVSLFANTCCLIIISFVSHRSLGEKLQAELFINKQNSHFEQQLSKKDLYQLLVRFVNKAAADKLLKIDASQDKSIKKKSRKEQDASESLLDYTRLQLSSVLGSASTRMVMKAASKQQAMPLEDVVNIVDEASKLFEFNRELLQAGVENIEQGISVIDADMRLVAWNQRYIELLDYPSHLVMAGKPISELIRFNIERGIISDSRGNASAQHQGSEEQVAHLIARRVAHMQAGHSHYFQRLMPSGIVIEIRGQAMPGGGFVSTFSDITAHIEAEKTLQKANESLEQRVQERTIALSQAKAEAEAANTSKTKFLAAASHDLMQPFNALSLFTNMLNKKVQGGELQELATNIQNSLSAAETLLSDLVEISRLDANTEKVEKRSFAVKELLAPLSKEFSVLCAQANIDFSYIESECFIESDQRMLRRVIQNFLSNALNYCPQKNKQGKIVLGVKRRGEQVDIQVWDNGPGIAKDKQQTIFKEFERLTQAQETSGLGLGLAISERIAKLLDSSISLQSIEHKGACFSISVPRVIVHQSFGQNTTQTNQLAKHKQQSEFTHLPILLIDNEELMLTAMKTQLLDWGSDVLTAKDESSLNKALATEGSFRDFIPALIISDYHLDHDKNGVDLVQKTLAANQWHAPCIICSADPSEEVREHTSKANFFFMRKPIKALALKKLMRQVLES